MTSSMESDGSGLIPGDEFVDSTGMPRFDDSSPEVDANTAFRNGFPQGEDSASTDQDSSDEKAFRDAFGHLPQEALSPEDQAIADAFASTQDDEEPEAASDEPEVLSEEQQEERSRALSALQRGGMKLEDFANVEVAIERGLKLADDQAAIDAKFAEKRKSARTDSTPDNDAVALGQTESHTQTDEELVEAFSEFFGEDGADVGTKISSRLQAQREAMDTRLSAVMEWMEQSELRQARASDSRLSSDKAWEATLAAYERIQASPAYEGLSGLHQAVRDATNMVLGPPSSARGSKDLDSKKKAGAVTSPNRKVSSSANPQVAKDVEGFRNAFKLANKHSVNQFGQSGIF